MFINVYKLNFYPLVSCFQDMWMPNSGFLGNKAAFLLNNSHLLSLFIFSWAIN